MDTAEVKVKFYKNPEWIYVFVFLAGILALPLVWITPHMDKNRKILTSLLVVAFCAFGLIGYFSGASILIYLMVIAWLYKTDKYIKNKDIKGK
jgi:hypothetical protein